jgi:outer membrane protein OmpA-like peptidoglycan-associated protein
MRRLIHNTTALAACLSLMVPHLAAAQVGAQPLRLAQAEGQPDRAAEELLRKMRGQADEGEQQEPRAEGRDDARPSQDGADDGGQRPQAAERQQDEPRPERAERQKKEERPERAERQNREDRPEQAEEQPRKERAKQAVDEATASESDAAAHEKPDDRPARAKREQTEDRPAAAAREQQDPRPEMRDAEAETEQREKPANVADDRPARKQQAEPVEERRPASSEDELKKALATEEAAPEPRPERNERAAGRQSDERATGERPESSEDALERALGGQEAAPEKRPQPRESREDSDQKSDVKATEERRPASRDDSDLAKALAAEQAAEKAGRDQNRRADDERPQRRQEREQRDSAEQDQKRVEEVLRSEQDDDQRAERRDSREDDARAQRRSTDKTDGAKEAARETRAPEAAALLEGRRGEVSEERITRENSRSSSEDFETSLRNAGREPEPRSEAREDDDDDKKDLAKALLLGLGAVAVGSMLTNNREVALSTPDRVVVTRADGSQEVIKDEVALLRQPGSTVTTEDFDDGSSRTIVTRADGSKVVTIRDADLRVLRRTLVSPDGQTTRLIDDTQEVAPVDVSTLPRPVARPYTGSISDEDALREALRREADVDRRFTLGQIRNIPEVRSLVPPINIDAITFETGSAAITPDQAKQLSGLGNVIQDAIADNPREIFLIEGHTDAVGSDAMNLALSDRRAESVALALSEYFDVPAENLVVQGYGEQFLQVQSDGEMRENRRASVRRITGLLQTAEAQ